MATKAWVVPRRPKMARAPGEWLSSAYEDVVPKLREPLIPQAWPLLSENEPVPPPGKNKLMRSCIDFHFPAAHLLTFAQSGLSRSDVSPPCAGDRVREPGLHRERFGSRPGALTRRAVGLSIEMRPCSKPGPASA